MIRSGQRDLFEESIIAQADDEDYQESGYVAVVVGDWAALSRYSHCSCYGTWADLTGGGISDSEGPDEPRWDWQGTVSGLVNLAKSKGDPLVPGREADPKDYDYDHLMEVYEKIIEWDSCR